MDYRYSNHVPHVQTSASIRGESCQAELCHVSCMNLPQHNEKTAVALNLIQFHPLTLPLSNFFSVIMIIIFDTPLVSVQRIVYLFFCGATWICTGPIFHQELCHSSRTLSVIKRFRQAPQLFFRVFLTRRAAAVLVNDVYIQSWIFHVDWSYWLPPTCSSSCPTGAGMRRIQ